MVYNWDKINAIKFAPKSPELKWVEEAADIDFEGLKKYTSLLHVFFKNEYIIQYKRDVLYGVTDFICKYFLHFS